MEEDKKNVVEFDITNAPKPPKEDLKFNFFRFIVSFWDFISGVMNIRVGTDISGTIEGIKKDIDFKGHSVWILIFSVFIASIGLNVNSTAVVIGAMLISPLMGPILGVGLSVGTNDWETLLKSLKGIGIAIVVSIATSYLYFLLTPLHEAQSELIARTKPTLLDVLVAIFGGLAGIIAGSRKEKSNVIPGVAIATALMPPLCTAGYGLAVGNFHYFFGAFYLFILNSVFITISTLVVVRYLRFPLVSFIDAAKEKKVKGYIIAFVLIVIVPSGFIFWDVIRESIFKTKAEQFLIENVSFEGTEVINKKFNYTDSVSTIELFVLGENISKTVVKNLNLRLKTYGISNSKLIIHQSKDNTNDIAGKLSQEVKAGILADLYEKNVEQIENKDRQIRFLEQEVIKYQQDSIPLHQIQKEIKIQFSDLQRFTFAEAFVSDFNTTDTIPTVLLNWNKDLPIETIEEQQNQLSKWLQIRLNLDTLQTINY